MRKQITRHLMCFCLGMVITGAAFTLPARAAGLAPEDFMRTLASDAFAVLSDDTLDQASRAHAFRRFLRRGFDLPVVSRFVLGRYWRGPMRLKEKNSSNCSKTIWSPSMVVAWAIMAVLVFGLPVSARVVRTALLCAAGSSPPTGRPSCWPGD